ncbi:glycosyltransferase family 4 protein [Candidatus Parcubacteria bacterium]|nr:glycosyltransferase family 4 protein [Candidatus Parcubacteria bacterium]
MKKLYYIANIRIPTEKAHGIQIMKMCEAFSHQGVEVELVVPERSSDIKEDVFDYYQVERNFTMTRLWCLDWVRFGKLGFWIESLTFAERVFWHIVFEDGVFYTRDEFMAACLSLIGKKTVWEVHMGQRNFLAKLVVKMGVPLVTISQGLKDLYSSAHKILVSPDAVDVIRFDLAITKEEAREKLGLPEDKKIVMYTGSLYKRKGVETLREASKAWGEDIQCIIVSGKPYKEIPLYLKAADVLVLPNSSKDPISQLYTSPMKLFEYMASGKPIVTSDVPSAREILDDSEAYFFTPDDAESLAHVIKRVFEDPSLAQSKAEAARIKADKYTWDKRAEQIIEFIS